jgi:hypothetical protein
MQIIAKNLRYNLLLRAALNIIVVLRGVVSQARRLVFVRRSLGCAARMGNTLPITHKVNSTSCLQVLTYYSTTKSCDNSYRCCFYSLTFAVAVVLMGRAARDTDGTCTNTVYQNRKNYFRLDTTRHLLSSPHQSLHLYCDRTPYLHYAFPSSPLQPRTPRASGLLIQSRVYKSARLN